MSKQFNHLNIPSHWQSYWTRFPEGHTILESLIQWVSQVDEMVDNQNKLSDTVSNYGTRLDQFIDQFEGNLSEKVIDTLGEWQQSGFLDIVIDQALETKFHEMDDRLTAQLAQKADRSQVDTFEARMEDIIQSSDLDPNKDQEVVDARLGSPTLGSKIQEIDEFSDHYAGSGVGVSSGRTLAWERGSLNTFDGSLYPSNPDLRTSDYVYGKKGNVIFLPDPQYVFTVLEYKSEDNYVGASEIGVNSYTIIGNQTNLFKIVISRKDGTIVHTSEIRDVSGKLFFSKNEGIINHIEKEISFNRLNLVTHEGEDYTWEPGVYGIDNDGKAVDLGGHIRTVEYLEVDKNEIISNGSSLEYYAIMYDRDFNMIDAIREYRIEDYVIENEAVKYIRLIIKLKSYMTSPQFFERVSSTFRVYKRIKDAFKEQNLGADRGYGVRISGVAVPDQTISSKGQNEPILSAIKLENGVAKGYLYHGDNLGDGLYYSPNKLDALEKIGELDFNPKNFMSIIGDDGEIIWVQHEGARTIKPRIHVDDYNQSSQIETEITPISWLQSCGIDYGEDENGEFIIFGEYTGVQSSVVGEIHLWKVRKPYNEPSNWKIVKTVKRSDVYRQGTVDEAWHFHTVQRDPYTNYWYATCGDSDLETKWWCSTDNGESWELLVDHTHWESQIARVLNFSFTEDYVYWGNDYGTNHSLNRVARNEETGVIDPSTRVKLAELNKLQSTYATILTHSPAGILLLDRVDPEFSHRTDELEIQFWSFDHERLHILSKLKRLSNKQDETFGFRCKAYTLNQGIYDTRLAVGFGNAYPNLLDIEGNNDEGRKTMFLEIF